MGRRADLVGRTRQRITEAAVRLHTTVGPSATSMSAVADEAGVTRLTLYRHFASKDELFGACMGHWRSLHPPPDPDAWRALPTFEARVRHALADVYRWYSENADDLYPIYRDVAHTPVATQRARQATNDRMVDAVIGDDAPREVAGRRSRAALGHVIAFWTWRSLVVDQSLSTRDAGALAAAFVLSAGDTTLRP
jgi:AcrR family transcriptional regulator